MSIMTSLPLPQLPRVPDWAMEDDVLQSFMETSEPFSPLSGQGNHPHCSTGCGMLPTTSMMKLLVPSHEAAVPMATAGMTVGCFSWSNTFQVQSLLPAGAPLILPWSLPRRSAWDHSIAGGAAAPLPDRPCTCDFNVLQATALTRPVQRP